MRAIQRIKLLSTTIETEESNSNTNKISALGRKKAVVTGVLNIEQQFGARDERKVSSNEIGIWSIDNLDTSNTSNASIYTPRASPLHSTLPNSGLELIGVGRNRSGVIPSLSPPTLNKEEKDLLEYKRPLSSRSSLSSHSSHSSHSPHSSHPSHKKKEIGKTTSASGSQRLEVISSFTNTNSVNNGNEFDTSSNGSDNTSLKSLRTLIFKKTVKSRHLKSQVEGGGEVIIGTEEGELSSEATESNTSNSENESSENLERLIRGNSAMKVVPMGDLGEMDEEQVKIDKLFGETEGGRDFFQHVLKNNLSSLQLLDQSWKIENGVRGGGGAGSGMGERRKPLSIQQKENFFEFFGPDKEAKCNYEHSTLTNNLSLSTSQFTQKRLSTLTRSSHNPFLTNDNNCANISNENNNKRNSSPSSQNFLKTSLSFPNDEGSSPTHYLDLSEASNNNSPHSTLSSLSNQNATINPPDPFNTTQPNPPYPSNPTQPNPPYPLNTTQPNPPYPSNTTQPNPSDPFNPNQPNPSHTRNTLLLDNSSLVSQLTHSPPNSNTTTSLNSFNPTLTPYSSSLNSSPNNFTSSKGSGYVDSLSPVNREASFTVSIPNNSESTLLKVSQYADSFPSIGREGSFTVSIPNTSTTLLKASQYADSFPSISRENSFAVGENYKDTLQITNQNAKQIDQSHIEHKGEGKGESKKGIDGRLLSSHYIDSFPSIRKESSFMTQPTHSNNSPHSLPFLNANYTDSLPPSSPSLPSTNTNKTNNTNNIGDGDGDDGDGDGDDGDGDGGDGDGGGDGGGVDKDFKAKKASPKEKGKKKLKIRESSLNDYALSSYSDTLEEKEKNKKRGGVLRNSSSSPDFVLGREGVGRGLGERELGKGELGKGELGKGELGKGEVSNSLNNPFSLFSKSIFETLNSTSRLPSSSSISAQSSNTSSNSSHSSPHSLNLPSEKSSNKAEMSTSNKGTNTSSSANVSKQSSGTLTGSGISNLSGVIYRKQKQERGREGESRVTRWQGESFNEIFQSSLEALNRKDLDNEEIQEIQETLISLSTDFVEAARRYGNHNYSTIIQQLFSNYSAIIQHYSTLFNSFSCFFISIYFSIQILFNFNL